MRWSAQVQCGTRERWLAARQIGSSDVARILGKSPYGGAYPVWRRLLGQPLPPRKKPGHMHAGLHWEPEIASRYQRETGRTFRRPVEWSLYRAPESHSTITPDGFVLDGGEWGLGELKLAVGGDRFRDYRFGPSQVIERWAPDTGVPVEWALQCMHQTWGLDAPWCDLVVLLPHFELRVYRLLRDREREARMVRRLRAWHQRHVVERVLVPRERTDAELVELKELYRPGGRGDVRQATPEETHLIQRLAVCRAHRKQYDTWERQLSFALIASAKRAAALLVGPRGVGGRASIVRPAEGVPHVRVTVPTTTKRRSAA